MDTADYSSVVSMLATCRLRIHRDEKSGKASHGRLELRSTLIIIVRASTGHAGAVWAIGWAQITYREKQLLPFHFLTARHLVHLLSRWRPSAPTDSKKGHFAS